ncbi:MAG: glycosyltransferase family 4 protein [Planctomycetota bacterium]|jgi:glycosyltransferase involved in cell wall biosynthesis
MTNVVTSTEAEPVRATMRICFISLGTFNHIGPYLDYFKGAGHDVTFVSMSPGPGRGVPTYNVGLGRKYSESEGKWKYPISMLRARRLIRKIKPDIVHAHYVTSCGLTALVCGFHPTVVTAHGSDLTVGIRSRIWRPLLKRIFEFSDCVNTVSPDLSDMVENLGIKPDKIETLTLGIDTEKFSFSQRRQFKKSRPLKLICTRRLESVFDHHTIIDALIALKEEQITFAMTFAGDGSLLDELSQRVNDVGLDDSVKFAGRLDNDDLPRVLSKHDVYLSASLWDGTSLSLMEAMATGLFPIVSDIRANSTWLEHDVNGLLHKVGDSEDLAECIVKFCNHPQMATEAAGRNREKVVESADRATNMKRLEGIYEKLLAKRR